MSWLVGWLVGTKKKRRKTNFQLCLCLFSQREREIACITPRREAGRQAGIRVWHAIPFRRLSLSVLHTLGRVGAISCCQRANRGWRDEKSIGRYWPLPVVNARELWFGAPSFFGIGNPTRRRRKLENKTKREARKNREWDEEQPYILVDRGEWRTVTKWNVEQLLNLVTLVCTLDKSNLH